MITRTVWKVKATGQKLVSIPANCGIEAGDEVIIYKKDGGSKNATNNDGTATETANDSTSSEI